MALVSPVTRPLRVVQRAEALRQQVAAASVQPPPPAVRESTLIQLQMQLNRPGTGTVLEAVAFQVPALVKALKTYSHTISAFPLRQYVNGAQVVTRTFLMQPSKGTTYSAEMMRLVNDLLLHDRAYWRVIERTWDNFPAAIVRLPAIDVVESNGEVLYKGSPVPLNQLIRFDGDGLGGWLKTGYTAITTAAALEDATFRYADAPLPSMILKNTGADLPADQVDAILDAWEQARQDRATAYLNSTLDAQPQGWNAAELQLVDAKNHAAIQIARMANLDPIWTGAGVPGSSLTYSNRVDLYRQLLDTGLTPVMNLITQRLSMNDVTPRGHTVTFDTSVFLRGNPADLASLVSTLLPLGIITTDEGRALMDLPMEVMQ